VVLLVAVYVAWVLVRPLPSIRASGSKITVQQSPGNLAWPGGGQAAVSVAGTNIFETHGQQTPVPIASTAKIITALVVLKQKPVALNDRGPVVTLTDRDVALYKTYAAKDGSVVPVQAGEKITEYQMLQAIMLPSANNMADSLAVWAYGSLPAYAKAADRFLADNNLRSTHIGSDASGLSPDTTSTAADLARLGKLAMANPVLAQIVGQSTAAGIPVAGTVKNVNFLLGNTGIIGVKTGNTDQAGGVFVGAAKVNVNNKPLTIVTAVAGAPSLFAAMKNSLLLIQSAQANFETVTIAKAGDEAGSYKIPWDGQITAVAAKGLDVETWRGSSVTANVKLQPIRSDAKAGQIVGGVTIPLLGTSSYRSVPVKLQESATRPSLKWRLLHPFN